jgi:hypothetical protein
MKTGSLQENWAALLAPGSQGFGDPGKALLHRFAAAVLRKSIYARVDS